MTRINDATFVDCYKLASINIPNSVTAIGDYAFMGAGLTSITIPSSVTSIGSYAFAGCTGLTSFIIPDGVTSISQGTFQNCYGLTSINIGDKVSNIGESAFQSCTALTSVTIPKNLTYICQKAFEGCYSLSSVNISDLRVWCNTLFLGNSSNPLYLAHHLFLNGTEITELSIPQGVTLISDYAFTGCTVLSSVSIPNSVTVIGTSVFQGCSGLTSVTIPSSVTSVGNYAFDGCRLENVIVKNAVPINKNAFSERTYLHAMLYVPVGTWGDVVYDTNLYQFNNIREMVDDTEELSRNIAYMLMNANTHSYAVSDVYGEAVNTMRAFYSFDETDPNGIWQLTGNGTEHYLYNIGAKKYASFSADGQIALSQTPVALQLATGEEGITIGEDSQTQWNFVLAKGVNTNTTVNTSVESVVPDTAPSGSCFDLQGRRLNDQRLPKGIYIKEGRKQVVR